MAQPPGLPLTPSLAAGSGESYGAGIRARARGRKVNSNKAVKLFRSRCAPRAFCRGGAEAGNSGDNSATAAWRFNKLGGEDVRGRA